MLANHDRLSRANPVRFICSSWIGTWVTDDRVTWRTTDCAWVAQLEPSANGRHICMAFYPHGVYQPDVPFTGPRSLALAGALLVARAHAGPRREVGGTWKATHVDPDLGDQDLRHALSDAGDGVHALERIRKRAHALCNLSAHATAAFLERVNVTQQLREPDTLSTRHPT